jgi:hypothetical protein
MLLLHEPLRLRTAEYRYRDLYTFRLDRSKPVRPNIVCSVKVITFVSQCASLSETNSPTLWKIATNETTKM